MVVSCIVGVAAVVASVVGVAVVVANVVGVAVVVAGVVGIGGAVVTERRQVSLSTMQAGSGGRVRLISKSVPRH